MKKSFFIFLVLISACQSPSSSNNPPDDHTVDKGGTMHKSGLNDPMDNCTECHGSDLKGGDSSVSCYECHGKKW